MRRNAMTEKRLAWDEYFAAQALLIANRSTCKRAKVGAVLVKDNKVISTGYNGSVSGTEHCIDHDCLAYVTHFPCLNCTKQLLQVGCERVVYINQYRMDDYAQHLYQEKGTELTHLPLETVQAALQEAHLI